MQGSFDKRTQPILFGRPIQERMSRVDRKRTELAGISVSGAAKDHLDLWIEIEFSHSTLLFAGLDIPRPQIEQIILRSTLDGDPGPADQSIRRMIEAFRLIRSTVRKYGRGAALTPELLVRINRIFSDAGFRLGAGDTSRGFQPVLPAHLTAAIETACHWFAAQSFMELHPVERAGVLFLRLIEIHPFEEENERTALLAASLHMLAAGLPPVIIRPDRRSAFRAAVEQGLQMNTKPMVEVVAESVEEVLSSLIDQSLQQSRPAK